MAPGRDDVSGGEAGEEHGERHEHLLPGVKEDLSLRRDHLTAGDHDHTRSAAGEVFSRAAIHTELGEPTATGKRAWDPADVLEQQPPQRAGHRRRHRDALRLRTLFGELAIDLGHRHGQNWSRLLERALVIELLELDAARELGDLRVQVPTEEA